MQSAELRDLRSAILSDLVGADIKSDTTDIIHSQRKELLKCRRQKAKCRVQNKQKAAFAAAFLLLNSENKLLVKLNALEEYVDFHSFVCIVNRVKLLVVYTEGSETVNLLADGSKIP